MISTLGVIIIAVGASVCVFVGGAVLIILFLRANDRRRRSKEEVAREFSAGQRGRLSVGSTNYSHVTEPKTNLRRSTHLPYGIVSEGWAAIPSQESIARYQTNTTSHSTEEEVSTQQKHRRTLRASFSAHSFSIPKTRRQKKIDRAVPLRAIPRSPLSAITERSGTNTTEASPSIEVSELPTEITPKTTPEKDENGMLTGRPISLQWPLITTNKVSCTEISNIIPVPTSRKRSLVRINSANYRVSPIRGSLGERSISMTSTLSIAPDDPLPPLPSITANQWPVGRNSRLRFSAASVDTIGSSVLGGGWASPSQTNTDLTSTGLATPPIDLNPTGLQGFEREGSSREPATVVTTGSPKARHATKYRNGRAGYGSFRANIGQHGSPHSTTDEPAAGSRDSGNVIALATRSALSTRHVRNREFHLLSRVNSVRSHASPSLPVGIARTGSGYRKGRIAARHSMYEQDTGNGSLTMDPAVLRDISGNPASPIRRPDTSRPASIASENPFHWDRNSLQTVLSSSRRSSPGSQSKGHKRQNCIRISNIPAGDTSRRASKLPQMEEEGEDLLGVQASKKMTIPGLNLLKQDNLNGVADSGQGHVTVPTLLDRPSLEQSLIRRPKCSRAPSSDSIISCNLDSDVFSNSHYDPNAPNIFNSNSTSQKLWPLTPTTQRSSRPQAAPPSLKAIQEPYDPDSPTLPVPAISSATLFAHALPLGTRVSGVQGPRNLPTSSRSSRVPFPSRTTAGSATKPEDLRRSVMTLRRLNSDLPDKTSTSHMYCNVGLGSANSLPNANSHDRQGSTPDIGVSILDISMTVPSSIAPTMTFRKASPTHAQASLSSSSQNRLTTTNLRLTSKSCSNRIAPSPSTLSAGTTSIWEDASVDCDSPEPVLPTSLSSSKIPSPPVPQQPKVVDAEAYENILDGQQKDLDCRTQRTRRTRRDRDRERECRLTSPQGKGLGLTGVRVQGQDQDQDQGQGQRKVWGAPESLYDGEGFLKD